MQATAEALDTSSVNHAAFTIERTYPVPPAKTFSAFADPVKKRRWYAEAKGFAVIASRPTSASAAPSTPASA